MIIKKKVVRSPRQQHHDICAQHFTRFTFTLFSSSNSSHFNFCLIIKQQERSLIAVMNMNVVLGFETKTQVVCTVTENVVIEGALRVGL